MRTYIPIIPTPLYNMQPPRTNPTPMSLPVIDKDPMCAFCGRPPNDACRCEAENLNDAVAEAEHAVMRSRYETVR